MRKREVPVKDLVTGERFPSVTAAARAVGVHIGSLREAIIMSRTCKGRRLAYDIPDVICASCKAKIEA